MKIKPLNENLLIKLVEEKDENNAVLKMDNAPKEKGGVGEIVAHPYSDKEEIYLVGKKIVFDKYIPVVVKIDGEEYYFVKEDDILGIYE